MESVWDKLIRKTGRCCRGFVETTRFEPTSCRKPLPSPLSPPCILSPHPPRPFGRILANSRSSLQCCFWLQVSDSRMITSMSCRPLLTRRPERREAMLSSGAAAVCCRQSTTEGEQPEKRIDQDLRTAEHHALDLQPTPHGAQDFNPRYMDRNFATTFRFR